MTVVHPWAPIEGPDARVLVLGTMPSPASLADGFYYGHPRNSFWPIMGRLFGAERSLPPGERARILVGNRVAVWDVLAECVRPGALDADIQEPRLNDIGAFIKTHRNLRFILFNGQKAYDLFMRHADPRIKYLVDVRWLPSTSPAHARRPEAKFAVWRDVFASALDRDELQSTVWGGNP